MSGVERVRPCAVDANATAQAARTGAREALPHVSRITGLTDAAEIASTVESLVVDHRMWARLNAASLDSMVPTDGSVAERGTAAFLRLLAPRVLGQFDPFSGDFPGRLYLLAPTIWRYSHRFDANLEAFALWVALHEQTHAVQFAAAPWLAPKLRAAMRSIATAFDEERPSMPSALRFLHDSWIRTADRSAPPLSLEDLGDLMPAGSMRELEVVLGAMSMLEGHAEVVMDAVGEDVVPGLRRIRTALDAARASSGHLRRFVARCTGLELKSEQYRQGTDFVRTVIAANGFEGINAAFSSPDAMPTLREISDPHAWLRRL